MRALVVGYFSTVGDLEVLSVVRAWLEEVDLAYDISAYHRRIADALVDALPREEIRPEKYTHLILVCGPFWKDFFVRNKFDLDKFSHCVRIGINLSMIAPLDEYDPLDVVVGRDSNHWSFPDLSFVENVDHLPVVGLCLAPPQGEYGERQAHDRAGSLLREAARIAGVAVQIMDTRWPEASNDGAIDSAAAFESILIRCDALLTTRLHGSVLALKNAIPVVALDPVLGGDKVLRQMREVGWPRVRTMEQADLDGLVEDLRWCLTEDATALARHCADRGREGAGSLRDVFHAALDDEPLGRTSGTNLLVSQPVARISLLTAAKTTYSRARGALRRRRSGMRG